jgi:hypothetical protein
VDERWIYVDKVWQIAGDCI